MVAAGVAGLISAYFIKKINSNKVLSILILPLILNPLEEYISNHHQSYSVSSEILIESNNKTIWNNIIEVPEIKEEEYKLSFFHLIGIPKPIKSQIKTINNKEYRIGYFTDGLELHETISDIDSLSYVNFKIHINESKLRNTPTDRHLLQSDYFKFDDISYRIEKINNHEAKLILNCNYTLDSKMNFYANFWAKRILKDFEENLLLVLKNKIEN